MNKRVKKEVETSCEYVLPDYMGDIKKILSSKARCIPGGRFSSDGSLEVCGTVEYEVIYADSENKLTEICTSSDYSARVNQDSDGYIDSSVYDRVINLNIRASGPRKISMKCLIESDITITADSYTDVLGDVFGGENSVQSSTRVIKAQNSVYGKSFEREYADEADRLAGLAGEDVEIIGVGGAVRITESEPTAGGVQIKGEVNIVAIVKTPEQPPFRINKNIPFSEFIEIEGATQDMQLIPSAYVSSAVIGASDDEADKLLVANAIVEFGAYGIVEEQVEVVTDAYLTDANVHNEYAKLEYMADTIVVKNDFRVDAAVPLDTLECAELREIICCNAEVKDIQCKIENKTLKINGNLSFSGVACEINADNSVGYIPVKTNREFLENVNINCQMSEKTSIKCVIIPGSCEAIIDSDGVALSCDVVALVIVGNVESIKRLSVCTRAEDIGKSSSSITVYYPTPEDTLFDVAKRFHTTVAKVAEENSIAESVSTALESVSLSGIKKLIIT